MTTLEKALDSAARIYAARDFGTDEETEYFFSMIYAFGKYMDEHCRKANTMLSDDVLHENGWDVVAYSDERIKYRLKGEKNIDILLHPFTGEYVVHYDGNVCRVKTLADLENFLSLVNVHLDLKTYDLFG